MALPDGLLEAAKNYLDITWTDPPTDMKLAGILARGISEIDEIAGAAQDYTIENAARGLLLDYARYARAGATDEFLINYQSKLLSLQMHTEVAAYVAESS